jgi:4'-phosphopantetheinyl transferase
MADACLSLLSAAERGRHDRFVFERDRHTFRVAHAMLRAVLGRYLGRAPRAFEFVQGPWGRPELTGTPPPLRFSLSHTNGLAACAVTPVFDCGVDVESRGRAVDALGVASRFFTAGEVAGLRALPEDGQLERFLALWTLKESVVKALGRGLSQPLDEIAFDFDGPAGDALRPSAALGSGVWRHWRWRSSERHCGALAVRCPDDGPMELTRRPWDAAALAAAL